MTAKRWDEARFNDLMRSVGPDLLAYFERRVGPDGADLLIELMMIAWRKHGQIPNEPTAARMWLFGVARNVIRNSQRGTIRRDRAGEALRSLTQRTAHQADPAESVAIRDLITRLEPDLAEVITLAHWEGFSHAEIGQLLGIPASTVRSRYQRAKTLLRAALSTTTDQHPGAGLTSNARPRIPTSTSARNSADPV